MTELMDNSSISSIEFAYKCNIVSNNMYNRGRYLCLKENVHMGRNMNIHNIMAINHNSLKGPSPGYMMLCTSSPILIDEGLVMCSPNMVFRTIATIVKYHCCPEKFYHKVGCSTEPASGTQTGVVG